MAEPGLIVGYVFLTKRPKDHTAWPSVYHKLELAEAAPNRVTAIATVTFDAYGNVVNDDLVAAKLEAAQARGERDEAREQLERMRKMIGDRLPTLGLTF